MTRSVSAPDLPARPARPARPEDIPALLDFLRDADLTLSGVESGGLRLWLLEDESGAIRGSYGFECSPDAADALVRSVAVAAGERGRGLGLALAGAALEEARAAGARTAWLFSRRSGPFWRRLGFEPAHREELAARLADTHQVRLFRASGQLDREVAWSRPL